MRKVLLIGIIFLSVLFSSCKLTDNDITITSEKEHSTMTMDQIWTLEDQNEFIIALTDYLCDKCQYGDNIFALSEAERVVYVTQWLEMEVNNGGFSQYLYNSAGNFANELVSAYGEIGAVKTAELCKEALSVFTDEIPTDREDRYDLMLSMDEDKIEEHFERCDNAFYEYEEDLESLTYAYVMQHREQFT